MDINDLHPPDDYSHRFFIWHEWIQANGPLTADNVFEYFTTSMFYDKQSNNQVLRMQTMHTGLPITNESEELKRFTGVEFAVVHSQPPSLFIIHKRDRLSPDEVRPLAAYFIMNNRIYQSPDLYSVLSNRLLTSLHSLQSSLDVLRTHRPDFTPRTGFVWPIAEQLSTSDEAKKKPDEDGSLDLSSDSETQSQAQTQTGLLPATTRTASSARRQQNNVPLFNAMRTTAAHSKLSFAPQAPEILSVSEPDSTPGPAYGAAHRASSTPRGVTPKLTQTQPEPGSQKPSGVKKKKKR